MLRTRRQQNAWSKELNQPKRTRSNDVMISAVSSTDFYYIIKTTVSRTYFDFKIVNVENMKKSEIANMWPEAHK